VDRALLRAAGARHDAQPSSSIPIGVSKQQAVPPEERSDQAEARSPKAVRQFILVTRRNRFCCGDDFPEPAAATSSRATCCERKGLKKGTAGPGPGQVPELDTAPGSGGGGVPAREVRKEGRYADPVKSEGWLFPSSFVREQLHTFSRAASRAGYDRRQHGPDRHVG